MSGLPYAITGRPTPHVSRELGLEWRQLLFMSPNLKVQISSFPRDNTHERFVQKGDNIFHQHTTDAFFGSADFALSTCKICKVSGKCVGNFRIRDSKSKALELLNTPLQPKSFGGDGYGAPNAQVCSGQSTDAENEKIMAALNTNVRENKSKSVTLVCQDGAKSETPHDFEFIFVGGELPTQLLKKGGSALTWNRY